MRRSRLLVLGLMLVATPVVCQLILTTSMTSMFWSMKESSRLARESRDRIMRLNNLMTGLSDFLFVMIPGRAGVARDAARNMSKSVEIHDELEQLRRDTKAELERIENDSNREQTKRIKEALDELEAVGTDSIQKIMRTQSDRERLKVAPAVTNVGGKLFGEISKLIEIEKAKHAQLSSLAVVDREKVGSWLLISMSASVALSALMALFFTLRIKAPLNRISKNLDLMSRNQPLLPVEKRNDELGALDRLIHKVGEEVTTALKREQAIIKNAADLICSLDEAGTFLTVNPMAVRMLALEPVELQGTRLNELVVTEDSLSADELIRRAIKSNDFQTAELSLRRADGVRVSTRWSCLWSDHESRLFCVAHDVTREKEVQRLREDFLSMISHDLRSPLASVITGLSLLTCGAKLTLPPSMQEEAESAVRNGEKLVTFITDLLDFQRLDAGQMPLDLKAHKSSELVEEAVGLVSAYAKSRSLSLQNRAGEFQVVCDRQKIIQVIVNLLSNAMKFSPEKSSIRIDVESVESATRFSVTDNGPGVPREARQLIFEPFQQLPSTRNQGTGLGLAISKMIVEAHGGEIGVTENDESPGSTGSVFWFTLPGVKSLG